jgi:hypothetical protein
MRCPANQVVGSTGRQGMVNIVANEVYVRFVDYWL